MLLRRRGELGAPSWVGNLSSLLSVRSLVPAVRLMATAAEAAISDGLMYQPSAGMMGLLLDRAATTDDHLMRWGYLNPRGGLANLHAKFVLSIDADAYSAAEQERKE